MLPSGKVIENPDRRPDRRRRMAPPRNLWNTAYSPKFRQLAVAHLAKLARLAPEQHITAENMIVRDEYLSGVVIYKIAQAYMLSQLYFIGVVLSADDLDREARRIDVVEYANTYLNVRSNPSQWLRQEVRGGPDLLGDIVADIPLEDGTRVFKESIAHLSSVELRGPFAEQLGIEKPGEDQKQPRPSSKQHPRCLRR
ncbi:hypothetical protein O1611_g2032 [Lasiodiplodia mahajangana]|uniref:Uncharacterized protein n=1 Tax=Lasiodiplodia mahajangana TaxID=1108764 RepID=A0ACC2JVV5_9PEZI|nr:hypothetical protein O1611_g2032 [Lasiodiplodia mahajangana]